MLTGSFLKVRSFSKGINLAALAEWDGEYWKVVRHDQFVEVTGLAKLRGFGICDYQ